MTGREGFSEQVSAVKKTDFIPKCLKYEVCLYCALSGGVIDRDDAMVQCEACCKWLHSI